MKNLKKKIFLLFLFFYLLIGSFNSLNTGISFDERYEELNWNFHTNTIKELSYATIGKSKFDKDKFDTEVKRFVGYGIGFQIVSQPIQFLLKKHLAKNKNLDLLGAKLISKHLVVFLFFFVSGIFLYLILRKIIDNENFCILSTILYFTYPYLFGQSMFSPKDIPFMSIWLICTYYSFIIFEKLINEEKIKIKHLAIFSIITAYLLSIRFAGILIFIQYLILFFLFLNVFNISFLNFVKKFYLKLIIFLFNLIIFIFIFNPIFLIDPLLIIETFKISTSHFNNVGTNTFGKIMYAKDLPPTYIPIWLLVKIPIIILIGIFTIPFTEKKIFKNKKVSIIFGNIFISTLLIPLILIFKKVHLYDEIRQIMFLVPLIFILGLVSLYTISKKLFYILGTITVIFFISENIKINPYQYVWFNLPSRYVDLSKKFELEYQGISGKEISDHLLKLENRNICILVNPIHSVKHFLNNSVYNCFDIWQKVDTSYKRPFLAVQNVRNLKKSMPYKCESIYETYFKLFLHKEKFITGKLLKCE